VDKHHEHEETARQSLGPWQILAIVACSIVLFLIIVITFWCVCKGPREARRQCGRNIAAPVHDILHYMRGVLPGNEGVPSAPPSKTLPGGWREAIDKKSGDTYFYHRDGRVQWEEPEKGVQEEGIPSYLEQAEA